MILYQPIVAGDKTYSVSNQSNLITFDVHNDSPYNAAVSFGSDVGFQNCAYYLSPHGILTGISPLDNSRKSVGNAHWQGVIYIYTQTPQGGSATTVLSSVPASQITVIGYPLGQAPYSTVAMSRWNNIGSPISTVSGTALSVQNDGNAPTTPVIEATAAGSSGSNVLIDNAGNITIAVFRSGTLIRILQMLLTPTAGFEGTIGTGQSSILMRGGIVLDTGISLPVGPQMSGWNWGNGSTGAGGSVVITHNLGAIPSSILVTERNNVNDIFSVDTITTTQMTVHVSVAAVRGFSWLALI